MEFSILMSIYHKEKADYLDKAMVSIWYEQSVKPNEIILVEDGKLTEELYQSIEKWKKKCEGKLKIISLEKNLGLGDALNIGLEHCSYEMVARMDTDDISLFERFEKQLNIFKQRDIDICSGWVGEFEKNENEIISYRKLPQLHSQILTFAKLRNPINHPAVMYRKSAVQKAGGYQKMMWFEDYYLWVRMLKNGAKFYNIQEPLVNMRAGYGQLQRRRGIKYAFSEYSFQKKLLKIKFINFGEFLRNILIRFISRIMPSHLLKKIYQKLRN